MKKSDRVWALIDCDCFFVSCERLRYPFYNNKALCVAWDIVIAKSYEAKKFWIKTWTPIWEAKKILKDDFNVLSPDHIFYRKVSDNLHTFLKEYFDRIEQFSIDEFFVDITDYIDLRWAKDYSQLVDTLKYKIAKNIWIPVSIWVSNTRLLAKTLSDLWKPHWNTVAIDPIRLSEIFIKLKLEDLPFLWIKTVEKLEWCETALDFVSLSYEFVKNTLKWYWLKVWLELNWFDAIDFSAKDFPKSIERSYSFNPNFTSDKSILESHLSLNLENAWKDMFEKSLLCNEIKVFLKDRDFNIYKKKIKLDNPSNDRKELFAKSLNLLADMIQDWTEYRSTWVSFSSLISKKEFAWLFYDDSQKQKEKLWSTINSLNNKYWKSSVRSASSIDNKRSKKTKDRYSLLYLWTVKSS